MASLNALLSWIVHMDRNNDVSFRVVGNWSWRWTIPTTLRASSERIVSWFRRDSHLRTHSSIGTYKQIQIIGRPLCWLEARSYHVWRWLASKLHRSIMTDFPSDNTSLARASHSLRVFNSSWLIRTNWKRQTNIDMHIYRERRRKKDECPMVGNNKGVIVFCGPYRA